MDDRLTEMLSRYLDDDLADTERAEFDRLLKTDARLRGELDGARRLRQAVASIASGMEPPAELDQVMEPLRRSAPAPLRRVRPVYRWLGAAAAVVVGVTVSLEMVRRNPSPTTVKPNRSVAATIDDREIFELAPLPTAVPNDNRPVGATDHLLEEQPPPPAAPEPPALEVVGPLTANEFSMTTESEPVTLKKDTATADSMTDARGAVVPDAQAALSDADRSATLRVGMQDTRDDAPSDPDGSLSQSTPSAAGFGRAGKSEVEVTDSERRTPSAPISILIDGVEVWVGASSGCDAGRWPVVLEIRNGIISGFRHAGGATEEEAVSVCRPADAIGSSISGFPDGEVPAEVVVRRSQ